jgi:hypothetical protein
VVQRLITRARQWADALGKPVALWVSDKQDAFVTGVAAGFPAVPHRYCANHFLRDLAKPVLEADSHAKVQMRRKVRGLRGVERSVLMRRQASAPEGPPSAEEKAEVATPDDPAGDVALEYCAAVRGILNNDQGGPLHPPGLEMRDALTQVRQSIGRNLAARKGGARKGN